MAFQVSPGVEVKEIDLTNVIPAVSTSIGAFAGHFSWGPVGEVKLVSSEKELINEYGAPVDTTTGGQYDNYTSFLQAASFLKYSNTLRISRACPDTARNAAGSRHGADTTVKLINNDEAFAGITFDGTKPGVVQARCPGTAGNSLQTKFAINIVNTGSFGDTTLDNSVSSAASTTAWAAANVASDALDEIHIAIIDEDGVFSGVKGTILEIYEGLSLYSDAVKDGGSNYYKTVINRDSKYVFINEAAFAAEFTGTTHASPGNAGSSGKKFNASNIASTSAGNTAFHFSLVKGVDGTNAAAASNAANVTAALTQFENPEAIDINLLFAEVDADGLTVIGDKIVDICGTKRKDCVGFISPHTSANSAATVKADFDYNDSYVVLDSSAVYVYNKYNDTFRYIPANGHIAGLCARTDDTNDPWFSPAGYNRGNLLGVTKLKWNPTKSDRDTLYKAGINPIISEPGQGILLFGDKTAQSKPSAFDRINVRRLFVVLEKAISTASKFQLFELNDEFTRAMFRNMTEPFLRDVKGRRGITDFLVVCDETNNTGTVIDANRFVADIYIKPARSINFITLNFVATRTGVEFSEIVGTGN
jgi:phage tail sheath protein FI